MIWAAKVMDNFFTTQPVSPARQPVPLCQYKIQAIRVAIFLLRTISFMSFMVFILCLPLGDPQETCTKEVCNKENVGQAYNYVCTVYRVLATTVKYTSNTMHDVSEYTSCFIVDALHDAKLKFYTLLSLVDKQDLCRTVCCRDDDDQDVELSRSSSSTKDTKKNCRCKTKCCKRQQQKSRDSQESLY